MDGNRFNLDAAMEIDKRRFEGPTDTKELIACVEELFRNQPFKGRLVDVRGRPDFFTASLEFNITNAEDLNSFLSHYKNNNGETLRIAKSYKLTSRSQYILQNYYRCQHKTRYPPTKNVEQILVNNPSKRFKNTNCPFSFSAKILKDEKLAYPCKIQLEWCHNHEIDALQITSFKDLTVDVTKSIRQNFMDGMTPGTAYHEYVDRLRMQCDSLLEFHKSLADRSICPRRSDFNRLYNEFNVEKFGGSDVENMLAMLCDRLAQAKETYPGLQIEYSLPDATNPLIIAFVTPLMQRVHKIVEGSGEMMFVDSSSNMEEYNLRVFLIVSQSVAGALPLGVMICSNEQTETLIKGFTLLKSCYDSNAFFGRGSLGPEIVMTDNCVELQDALKLVWPTMKQFLCLFHMLKQVWTWLNDSVHGILHTDRPRILYLFKKVIYGYSAEDFGENDQILRDDNVVSKYLQFLQYYISICQYKQKWALCYRLRERTRGSNTNNFVEAQFNVLKDSILKRCKEYNVNGLLDKLLCEFDNHYQTKLLSVASGTFDGIYSRRFSGKANPKKKTHSNSMGYRKPDEEEEKNMLDSMIDLGNGIFIVTSSSIEYTCYLVDMGNGICACFVGSSGSPCKHQYVIWKNRVSNSQNFLPVFDKTERQKYAKIAIGESLPLRSYEGLHERMLPTPNMNTSVSVDFRVNDNCEAVSSRGNNVEEEVDTQNSSLKEKEKESLKENLQYVLDKIDESENNLATGVLKFTKRCKALPMSRLPSAFHEFGNNVLGEKSKKRRKSFTKISVQPGSVKRRKCKNGSRQKQSSGRKLSLLKPTLKKALRPHHFAETVRKNQAVSKVSRCVMSSKTKLRTSQVRTDECSMKSDK